MPPNFSLMIIVFLLLLLGGAYIIWFALKRVSQKFKIPILIIGSSLAGFPIFSILHNLVYALMVTLSSQPVEDEPFFFILATLVCPIGFITGLIWMVVIKIKGRDKG